MTEAGRVFQNVRWTLISRLEARSRTVHEAGWAPLQRLQMVRRVEWADCQDEPCLTDRAVIAEARKAEG